MIIVILGETHISFLAFVFLSFIILFHFNWMQFGGGTKPWLDGWTLFFWYPIIQTQEKTYPLETHHRYPKWRLIFEAGDTFSKAHHVLNLFVKCRGCLLATSIPSPTGPRLLPCHSAAQRDVPTSLTTYGTRHWTQLGELHGVVLQKAMFEGPPMAWWPGYPSLKLTLRP